MPEPTSVVEDIFSGKKVLVTGGTGMIGTPLVEMLLERGAVVRVASMDDSSHLPKSVAALKLDLTLIESCRRACEGMDQVFHLAGVKGGVGIGRGQAARFFELNSLMNLHMLKAAHEAGVKRYLFTSSIGVYPDVELFREDEVWHAPPHRADWYGAWSKRLGELQCEAYREQYGFNSCIVRPATIFGPYDNFDPRTAMVIPALIARAASGEDPLVVWGDGSARRDFIFSKDCALGMLQVMERHCECDPVNLGSGVAVSIFEIVEMIVRCLPKAPRVEWDASKPTGNKIRLMDMTKAKRVAGFSPSRTLEAAIRETVNWYLAHKEHGTGRFKAFAGGGT